MAERRFGEAETHFRRAQEGSTVRPESMIYYRVLALAYDGRLEEAKELAAVPFAPPGAQPDDAFWRFCRERFGIERPGDAASSGGGA
jgi:hypothetical protein